MGVKRLDANVYVVHEADRLRAELEQMTSAIEFHLSGLRELAETLEPPPAVRRGDVEPDEQMTAQIEEWSTIQAAVDGLSAALAKAKGAG